MIRAIQALSRLRERENHRYWNASPEEKERIKEEWGIIRNPTEEQCKFRRFWCESAYRMGLAPYGLIVGLIPSLAAGFATLYYAKPNPESLEGLLPAVAGAVTWGGIFYVSFKVGDLLHRRKHPTGRECNDEYVQRGLELIAELESRGNEK